jgi:branched-chain amino acid aminotransferase
MKVWLNGKIVDSKDAKVSVFDRGFLYGDGVFDTMRAYDGSVFALEDHLARLERSLRIAKIKVPYTKKKLAEYIRRLLKLNRLKNAYIRVSVSRGEGRFGIDMRDDFTPTVVIMAKEFAPYPRWMYDKGITAKVVTARLNELSPVSRIKSLNFLNNILAKLEAKEAGFDEAILMSTRGFISEASTSNIFIVAGEKVITPKLESGALAGVTRKVVLKLAGRLKFLPWEKFLSYSELVRAEEVFLTSSLVEIVPIVNIDGHKINNGRPGRVTANLAAAYKELTKIRRFC